MEKPPDKPPLDLGRKIDSLNEAPEVVMRNRIRQAEEERKRLALQKEAKEP